MAAPTGSDYQIGWCFERGIGGKPNLPGAAINNFLYAKNVTGLQPKPLLERSANMIPNGRTPAGRVTRFTIAPKIEYEADVDMLPRRRAWFNGLYSIATPVVGVKEWTMRPRERTDVAASYVDTIDQEITDGARPLYMTGAKCQDFELKIEDGKLVSVSETQMGCLASWTSEATGTPATYTGKPVVVGNWGVAAAAAGTLKVKVEALAGGGNDGYVRFTTGAAYAGANIPIKFDTWIPIVLGDGTRAGVDIANNAWMLFPSGAGALAVADEWTFTETRTLATPSYSTRDPLSTSAFRVSIDGTVYGDAPGNPGFRSATLKIAWPKKPYFAGGIWPHAIQRDGDPMLTLKVSRDREDAILLDKCRRGSRVALVLDIYGNPIGSTVYDELWRFTMPTVEIADVVRDINTKNALPEDADLVAVGLTGPTYTELVRCTVGTI